jgi:hypothetical protein
MVSPSAKCVLLDTEHCGFWGHSAETVAHKAFILQSCGGCSSTQEAKQLPAHSNNALNTLLNINVRKKKAMIINHALRKMSERTDSMKRLSRFIL